MVNSVRLPNLIMPMRRAALDKFVFGDGADDAAGDQSDDLADDDDVFSAARFGEDDGVGFVCRRGLAVTHGVDEFAFFVGDGDDFSVAWTAVDVNIEDGEEDSDADGGAADQVVVLQLGDVGNLSIRRRNDRPLLGGDGTFGIAEEGEEPDQDRHNDQGQRPDGEAEGPGGDG